MFIDSLQRHLAICAQPDLPGFARRDPRFWNVISIREPYRPTPDTSGFLRWHETFCLDVSNPDDIEPEYRHLVPGSTHLDAIESFADSSAGDPLLVHCWAGQSRSTAVAVWLIARAMHHDGYSIDEIAAEAPDLVLALRPCAAPNPLILRTGLHRFLDPSPADELTVRLLNEPRLFANRHHGASPS